MERIAAATEWALRVAAVVLLLGMLGCVVAGVVSRQLGNPLSWTDEAAQYLLVWTGFTGMVLAARRRSHIRIDVFIDRLPPLARRVAEVIIQASVIFFAFALLRYSPALIERNLDVEWISVPLSAALLYIPLPIAAVALVSSAVVQLVEAFRGPVAAPQAPGDQPL
jgi:TRAP-type C4-dicarboxylate transport system permease small subunit